MTITKEIIVSDHGQFAIYTLTNASGATVRLSEVGAGIVALSAPDRIGRLADVVIGYAQPADYFYDGPCAGKIPGRYANRIARGQFSLDGNNYQLAINNGPNALHGGPEGFSNKIWQSEPTENGVVFTLESPDGDENYPGNLKVRAEYTWNDENELRLDISATTDKKTAERYIGQLKRSLLMMTDDMQTRMLRQLKGLIRAGAEGVYAGRNDR